MTMNGHAPTPARRIRELMTTTVTLPMLSKQGGSPVAVRIRMLSRHERQEILDPLPTAKMTLQEMQAYLESLAGPERAEYHRQADDADQRIILAAVVIPEVTAADAGDPETTIPLAALWPDRATLILEILRFSGFLAMPWEPPAEAPAAAAGGLAEAPAERPFRAEAPAAPEGDPTGTGGALPVPTLIAPAERAG